MADLDKKLQRELESYEVHCRRIERATTIDLLESPTQRLERIKRLESNYIDWFEYYFPNFAKSRCSWFHAKLAQLVIMFRVIFLMAIWFRSSAKSVHLVTGIE